MCIKSTRCLLQQKQSIYNILAKLEKKVLVAMTSMPSYHVDYRWTSKPYQTVDLAPLKQKNLMHLQL